ncbi:MAG: HlyD family efflux transporter periplasmic adaptor subunit [Clostridiales bacterium]|nr:HlyD family efflux transporter periplasmic adaptor subunit [Clostridiales bacterium]
MSRKKKKVLTIGVALVIFLVICTFISKSVYYFSLPKVTTTSPYAATFLSTATLTSGTATYKNIYKMEFDLPVPLEIEEVLVTKGDIISEGSVLARFDIESIEEQIIPLRKAVESAEIALLEFRRAFEAKIDTLRSQIPDSVVDSIYTVKAHRNGIIADMAYKEGDRVSAGSKLCSIADTSSLILSLYFSDAYQITPGMKAKVSIPSMMSVLDGDVIDVGNTSVVEGTYARLVTIRIKNPGTVQEGLQATATIGEYTPMNSSTLKYGEVHTLYSEVSGYLKSILHRENSTVGQGDTIMKIEVTGLDSAQKELDHLLTTGILNGRTENQLAQALDEAKSRLDVLEKLLVRPEIQSMGEGVVCSVYIEDGIPFSGGVLMDYAQEGSEQVLVFTGGDIYRVSREMPCAVTAVFNQQEFKMEGVVGTTRGGKAVVHIPDQKSFVANASEYSAEVILKSHTTKKAIPATAFITDDDVYVVKSRRGLFGIEYYLQLREVERDWYDSKNVEITSGLAFDDLVVVGWDREIYDGAIVDLVGS